MLCLPIWGAGKRGQSRELLWTVRPFVYAGHDPAGVPFACGMEGGCWCPRCCGDGNLPDRLQGLQVGRSTNDRRHAQGDRFLPGGDRSGQNPIKGPVPADDHTSGCISTLGHAGFLVRVHDPVRHFGRRIEDLERSARSTNVTEAGTTATGGCGRCGIHVGFLFSDSRGVESCLNSKVRAVILFGNWERH